MLKHYVKIGWKNWFREYFEEGELIEDEEGELIEDKDFSPDS